MRVNFKTLGGNFRRARYALLLSSFYYNHGVDMGFWRVVFTILIPPLGVLLGKGFGWAFILNIILTLLGYIPGLIHAFWVQTRD